MNGLDKVIEFLLSIIQVFWFWRVIPINKKGVRLRFGKNPIILDAGFYFVYPFEIDNIKTCVTTPEWGSSESVHITTADYKTITVSPTIKYKIVDAIKWVYAENDAITNLYEIMRVVTVDILSDCNFEDCLKKSTYTRIKNKIKDKSEDLGIEILDFGLTSLSISRIIITQV